MQRIAKMKGVNIMKKTFNFGKIDYCGRGRKDCAVDVVVRLEESEKGEKLSICGDIWNRIHTDVYCGGQCLDTIKKFLSDNELFMELYRFWKLYHLNDMHAGTPEQEAAIEEWKKQGNKFDYKKACEYLQAIGLYEVDLNGKPYKYGHAWLYQPIPESDLARIKELLSNEK